MHLLKLSTSESELETRKLTSRTVRKIKIYYIAVFDCSWGETLGDLLFYNCTPEKVLSRYDVMCYNFYNTKQVIYFATDFELMIRAIGRRIEVPIIY